MSFKMSTNKHGSLKCRHFCFPLDLHNYCPTCREAEKGDDPCVINYKNCQICSCFSEEQLCKIKNRKRYTRKHKSDSYWDASDLLGYPEVNEVYSRSLGPGANCSRTV